MNLDPISHGNTPCDKREISPIGFLQCLTVAAGLSLTLGVPTPPLNSTSDSWHGARQMIYFSLSHSEVVIIPFISGNYWRKHERTKHVGVNNILAIPLLAS